MTPWLGLDRLGFFLIRIFLRLCTRANALPSNPDELQLAPNTPVVYVLRDRSAADAAAAAVDAGAYNLDAVSVDFYDFTRTMQAYALRGTPSLILIDRQGRIRLNHFGIIDDLQLGAIVGQLLTETNAPIQTAAGRAEKSANPSANCDDGACPAPD